MKKLAPYLVLIAVALSSCTNREILHGSSADRPPSLKVAKKLTVSVKTKTDNRDVDTSKKDGQDEDHLRIWFAKESQGSVQPFAVERVLDKKEPLRSAVNQLLQGPTEEERKNGVKSEVPVGTVLISLKKKDNVVELNLSRRFGAGGVDSIETRLQQLELTIKEVGGHDKVYLDVEGKRLTSAGDGLEVKQPLNL